MELGRKLEQEAETKGRSDEVEQGQTAGLDFPLPATPVPPAAPANTVLQSAARATKGGLLNIHPADECPQHSVRGISLVRKLTEAQPPSARASKLPMGAMGCTGCCPSEGRKSLEVEVHRPALTFLPRSGAAAGPPIGQF